MSTITAGTVSIEDAVKKPVPNTDPQYFPSKRVRVDLSFSVAEGEDASASLDNVAALASAKVQELLTGEVKAAAPVASAPKATRTKAKAAEKPADPAAIEDPSSLGDVSTVETSPPKASDAGSAQTTADVSSVADIGDVSSSGDNAAEIDFDEPIVTEITDADLTAAVTKKNGEIKDAPRIRELIVKYQPEAGKPAQLRLIPQATRQAFLDALAALKAA